MTPQEFSEKFVRLPSILLVKVVSQYFTETRTEIDTRSTHCDDIIVLAEHGPEGARSVEYELVSGAITVNRDGLHSLSAVKTHDGKWLLFDNEEAPVPLDTFHTEKIEGKYAIPNVLLYKRKTPSPAVPDEDVSCPRVPVRPLIEKVLYDK